jgi:hypothetical protein
MFWNVLLLGALAGSITRGSGPVAVILSRTGPLRVLVAYLVGGFEVSPISRAVALSSLKHVGVGKKSVHPGADPRLGPLARTL